MLESIVLGIVVVMAVAALALAIFVLVLARHILREETGVRR
ncbi:MAG: hypothetical protein QOE90_323 [Thermoplasmata archaeon]|jgi:hypothetical protein|nr:hypothetical protein [Thermoplasmata archaeon]